MVTMDWRQAFGQKIVPAFTDYLMLLGLACSKLLPHPDKSKGLGFSHAAEACRQSGFGVEGGIKALESYTRLQSIETSYGS